MIKFTRFLFGLMALTLLSCDPCKNVLPTPNYFELSMVDSTGEDLLVTTYTEPGYPLIKDHAALTKRINGEGIRIFIMTYASFESGKDYYFYLSPTEIDTISIDYTKTQLKCFTDFKLNQFMYNGVPHTFTSGIEIKMVK